jgi:hypothetical protein
MVARSDIKDKVKNLACSLFENEQDRIVFMSLFWVLLEDTDNLILVNIDDLVDMLISAASRMVDENNNLKVEVNTLSDRVKSLYSRIKYGSV